MSPLPLSACLSGQMNIALNLAMCEATGEKLNYIEGPEALGNCHAAVTQNLFKFQVEFAKKLCAVMGWPFPEVNCITYVVNASAIQRSVAFIQVAKPELIR